MEGNRKVHILLALIISLIIFAGCNSSGKVRQTSTHNPTGEEILNQNKDAAIAEGL